MSLLTIPFFLFFIIILIIKIFLDFISKKTNKNIAWFPLFAANLLFPCFMGVRAVLCLFIYLISSFIFGLFIEKTNKSKVPFVISLVLLAGVLVVSKFLTFNLSFLNIIPGFNINNEPILMPIGMAYYSLVTIAYVYDIYSGKIHAEHNFIKYFIYTGNFLKIFQGPIECYNDEISTRVMAKEFPSYEDIVHNAQLVLWGLFKKMVIADWLAIPVSTIFDAPDRPCGSIILYGAILFYLQLYSDFSGCIDIIRGCSGMLGVKVSKNFNHPFFATSVADFWHRWHISLSTWLKNYIYIPLGGNRKGKLRTYLNIIVVFLVSGFWHGAGIKYLAWGLLHSFLQIIERLLKEKSRLLKRYNESRLAQIIITFFVISLTWIFFRCSGFMRAFRFYREIIKNFNFPILIQNLYEFGLNKSQSFVLFIFILFLVVVESLQEFMHISITKKVDGLPLVLRWIVYLVLICLILIFGYYGPHFEPGAFIYEQF